MERYVITIARGHGSGGKTIGKMLSEQLGVEYYDRDLIRFASDESGINVRLFGLADERVKGSLFQKKNVYQGGEPISPASDDFISEENLFNYQAKTIKQLAERENCIIVGRCADYVLRGIPYVTRVFVFASQEACIQNIVEMYGKTPKEAERIIERTDRERSTYYKRHTGHDWDNARNYDLCLDSSALGFQKCVDIIRDYIKIKAR